MSKNSDQGINQQRDIVADLQIGPTSMGMVRLYIKGVEVDLPLEFSPDDAEEIAQELYSAAELARKM